MIIAITGGRRTPITPEGVGGFVLVPSIHQLRCFWDLCLSLPLTELVHGRALGTDRAVAAYVENRGRGWDTIKLNAIYSSLKRLPLPDPISPIITAYPVDIRVDGPWPLAGHNRNRRMLTTSGAQGVIAFPGGGGTEHCVRCALGMGLQVWRWEGDREQGEFKGGY